MGLRKLTPVMVLFSITFVGIHWCQAQQDDADPDIKIHTAMERYAPEYVLTPEERLRLKSERRETIASRRAVIDTLDISRRKKRRLLNELYNTPFSDQYQEVLSSLEEEDEEQIPD